MQTYFDLLEARWQYLVGSTWANRWLPEVRYLQGWNLREVAILLLIGGLTSSWYTIRNQSKLQKHQLQHEDEISKQEEEENENENENKETTELLEQHGDGLLARVVANNLFSPLMKKKKKPDDGGEEEEEEEEDHKKAQTRWTSPSLVDGRLLSMPKLDLVPASLGFSVGTSWERRYQTMAMFSCSLAVVMYGTSICFALVVHFGFLLPYHIFVSGDLTPDDQYVSFFQGILPDWYHSVWVGLVAACTWYYLIWMVFLDDSPSSGSRVPWIRNYFGGWFNHACDFLPVVLVKTADLPAYETKSKATNMASPRGSPVKTTITTAIPQKYVLGYHPHGIIAVGAFCAFATDGARIMDLSKNNDDDDDYNDSKSEASSGPKGMTLTTSFISLLNRSATSPVPPSELDDAASGLTGKSAPPPPARGFSTLFPNLDRRVVTLPINFKTPLLREYLLSMGAVTSEKQTFRRYLSGQKPSGRFSHPALLGPRAMVVVVGGAAESMLAHEGQIELVLKQRRGFVREAILAGANLVPVLGFGETNLYTLYDNEEGDDGAVHSKASSAIATAQNFIRKTFGVAVPLFSGRSVFLKSLGVMPRRRPVVVVVGKPIKPPTLAELDIDFHHQFEPRIYKKTDEASNEHGKILIEWHSKYVKALEELYAEYKDAPWNGPGKRRQNSMRILR